MNRFFAISTISALSAITSMSLPLAALSQSSGQSTAQSVGQTGTPAQTQAPATTYSRQPKNFQLRKRFIAPSSDLYNRIDYSSMPSRDALMLPTYEPTYGKTPPGPNASRPPLNYQPIHPDEPQEALKAHAQSLNDKSVNIKPMVNRDGLTPPPPPANNKLLPTSLTGQSPAAPKVSSNAEVGGPPLSAAQIAHIKGQAETFSRQGHLGEAQDVLNRSLQAHPKEPVLRAELSKISLERARFFSKQGNAQQAASQARLAIAYGSAYSNASESAYSILASSLTKAGIDPRNAEARANLGANLLAQNNPMEAEIEYRQAIKIKPEPAFYIGAGNAANASGNKTSAKMDFQKALELNPESQPALSNLGVLRYQMRDYVGANADLTRALVMNSQDTTAAQTLLDLWQRQVGSRPNDATAHFGLARAYQVTGDLDSARAEYKTVVRLDPQNANLPAARQSFKLALARREARKSFDLAHSLETQGQLANAYQKASDAVELYPSESNYQNYKLQLAGQLQAAGMPVYAASGQAMQALSNLVSQEQPAATNLPTAQALGLNSAAQAAAAANSNIQGAPVADNMYRVSTDNHIASMGSFLAGLRNYTMQQQQQGLDTSGGLGGGAASAMGGLMAGMGGDQSALAAVPGFGSSNPLPGATLPASLDQGQMIAQGAAARGPVTASSAMQAAAQALANTQNIGGGGLSAGTYGMAGVGAGSAAGGAATTSSATAMGLSAAPGIMPTMIGGLGRATDFMLGRTPQGQARAQALAMQNQQNQPSQQYGLTPAGNFATSQTMPTTVTQRAVSTGSQDGAVATAQSMSVNPDANTNWPQPQPLPDAAEVSPAIANAAPLNNAITTPVIAPTSVIAPPSVAATAPATTDPTSQATAATLAPPIVAGQNGGASSSAPNSNTSPAEAKPELRSLIPPGAVKLYLTGVKASKSDVQLFVSLRNDGSVPLKIPSGIKAIVRTTGQPDKEAKVLFASKVVASGSTISGTIRVPGKSLDPTSDVVIPTGELTRGAIADIHLSVPISAK